MKLRQKYDRDEDPAYPAIDGELYDPLMKRSMRIRARIDSGFSGSLLLGIADYLGLGLQLYEEPENAFSGRLVTGISVPLRASRGVLRLGSEQLECLVYATPLLSKPLLGRQLLKSWVTTLDGPGQTTVVRSEEQTTTRGRGKKE
jgi:predicted aspartyl protease